ncbi:MAG TPA: hypothetical protein VFS67_23255 [Polyangiaceae bacterium]|nr:hypothetical protein [Polyangiaceae bacterium]
MRRGARAMWGILAVVCLWLLEAKASAEPAPAIDRRALVQRHSPSVAGIDPESPFMVGNGSLALAADLTGLATFPERYAPLAPLMIQAQWAWHSFPNPAHYTLEQALVPVEVRGRTQRFPWLHDWSEAQRPEIQWLRENPHRFSLGRLALHLVSGAGRAARLEDLSQARQTLELWTGRLLSSFEFDGARVELETSVHPQLDLVIVKLSSPLLAAGRLGVDLKFPGVSAQLNPDPADWQHPATHRTIERGRGRRALRLERQLDATRYQVLAQADRDLAIERSGPHEYRFSARGASTLTLLVAFSEQPLRAPLPSAEAARSAVARSWKQFWQRGGAVDFSGSRDPRAPELERRVVLSQYLMAVNAAGRVPPQEEGLFSNSWNGKFHLEMHAWHEAQFALWGHPELLERSMGWYLQQLPNARRRAQEHGARGAWWPKMVGPEGRESPSTITPFIMWQQPGPIWLAELLYRAQPTPATLRRYRQLVFETAELLASFPHFDAERARYVLGPPIIPAQEVFPPLSTFNPTFELEYFRFGLATAQSWRERLGLARDPSWQRVLEQLAPLPQKDGLYLATESQPEIWGDPADCKRGAGPQCLRRDHPSFVAALGLLPGAGVDRETMRRTLSAVVERWDLRRTWGWDFPMLAMTATRLGERRRALDFLFWDAENFRFGRAGMTPRAHLDDSASPPRTVRDALTYFPSNGSLLVAVALMVAGWDGSAAGHPGFPDDGSWVVRSEGVRPLP